MMWQPYSEISLIYRCYWVRFQVVSPSHLNLLCCSLVFSELYNKMNYILRSNAASVCPSFLPLC